MKLTSLTYALLEFHLRLKSIDVREGSSPNRYEEHSDTPVWKMVLSNKFKKGFKKQSRNAKFLAAFNRLIANIKSQSQQPQIRDYPVEFNVHVIGKNKIYPRGALDAHVRGDNILLVFNVDYQKRIMYLYALGTHKQVGL